MIPSCNQFGPWTPGLKAAERGARLRAMRTLARVQCGPRAADLVRLLAQAEADPAALEPALAALNRLASHDRRHVLASYAALSRSAA
ncbi:hypothetical protein [Methylobacterium sp. J-076]|uniref:hypothetical protein n=1 Tax=Methylobacterium sp. J-076 TaxID=2836655 RepID=UPI001FBAEE2E|nr:hypothetical protein [Methylobacterium sp. J-076]MCJ2011238.1 hypothetical protein [Methylobacterium sp. J-076]